MTEAQKQMHALFEEETAFESVNEKISSEILQQILSHDASQSSSDFKLGSDVRKSDQSVVQQKLLLLSFSLLQVIRASVSPPFLQRVESSFSRLTSDLSFPRIETRGG